MSCEQKLFIAELVFGAMPEFSGIMRACLLHR